MEFKERTVIPFSAFLLARSQMPQVEWKSLKKLLDASRISYSTGLYDMSLFKPTQYEFSQDKVDAIKSDWLSNPSLIKKTYIIVSEDCYVLDGHHRYFAALQYRTDINVIRIDLPINKLLKFVQDSNND